MADNVPELTSQYHRSRMLLVLFSGLLGAWELLGCKLDGKLFGVLTVEHQNLIPLVLLLCTLYYGVRLGIEWYQSSDERRQRTPSQVDLSLAFGLAVLALIVFLVQKLAGVNIGDKLQGAGLAATVGSWFAGFGVLVVFAALTKKRNLATAAKRRFVIWTYLLLSIISVVLFAVSAGEEFYVAVQFFGLGVLAFPFSMVSFIRKRLRGARNGEGVQ